MRHLIETILLLFRGSGMHLMRKAHVNADLVLIAIIDK
jgi:hypothetical protein